MDNNLFEKSKYFVASATTAATIFSFALGGNVGDVTCTPISSLKYSAENIMLNPYYSIASPDIETVKEINIIHQFASKIIENTEDLDPSIVELVNDNFWKLV